jgi:oligopeptide/dipeptide ABC transporter ATP-binding protein
MEFPILEFKKFRMSYHSRYGVLRAITDASLRVEKGEAVGLVGESGSGKSSLARAALGLLPEGAARIEGGEILIDGRNSTHLKQRDWERERGSPIAIVFQDPLAYLNPIMRIGKQIAESVERHDPSQDVTARVAELLQLVKLPSSVQDTYPHELSGGMRQRVLLAIALGCKPQLLIADEPTTALDVTTQAEILALLRELQRKLQMALLLISHDLGIIASSCDRLYVMYAGATIESGATKDVFARPAHPYTRGLLAAAEAALDKSGRFATIEGDVPNLAQDVVGCPFAPRCEYVFQKCRSQMPGALMASLSPGHVARCWLFENGIAR